MIREITILNSAGEKSSYSHKFILTSKNQTQFSGKISNVPKELVPIDLWPDGPVINIQFKIAVSTSKMDLSYSKNNEQENLDIDSNTLSATHVDTIFLKDNYKEGIILNYTTKSGEIESNYTLTIVLEQKPESEYYVSAYGDDTNNDGSESKPFKTIKRALESVAAADFSDAGVGSYAAIKVAADGTYTSNEDLSTLSGIGLDAISDKDGVVIEGGYSYTPAASDGTTAAIWEAPASIEERSTFDAILKTPPAPQTTGETMSKITIKNFEMKRGLYNSADLTVENCIITASINASDNSSTSGVVENSINSYLTLDSSTVTGNNSVRTAIYNNGVTLDISGGTITGVKDSTSTTTAAYAINSINSAAEITISGATIVGASGGSVGGVYAIYGPAATIGITGATITGMSGGTSTSSVYAILSSNTNVEITIDDSTIVGAENSSLIGGSSGSTAINSKATLLTISGTTTIIGIKDALTATIGNVHAIYNNNSINTTITIDGEEIEIVGALNSSVYNVFAIYSNVTTLEINSATITAIKGGTAKSFVYALHNLANADAAITINGATIVGAQEISVDTTLSEINFYAIYSKANTISITGGTIKGTIDSTITGTSTVTVYAINSGNTSATITIDDSTIVGAEGGSVSTVRAIDGNARTLEIKNGATITGIIDGTATATTGITVSAINSSYVSATITIEDSTIVGAERSTVGSGVYGSVYTISSSSTININISGGAIKGIVDSVYSGITPTIRAINNTYSAEITINGTEIVGAENSSVRAVHAIFNSTGNIKIEGAAASITALKGGSATTTIYAIYTSRALTIDDAKIVGVSSGATAVTVYAINNDLTDTTASIAVEININRATLIGAESSSASGTVYAIWAPNALGAVVTINGATIVGASGGSIGGAYAINVKAITLNISGGSIKGTIDSTITGTSTVYAINNNNANATITINGTETEIVGANNSTLGSSGQAFAIDIYGTLYVYGGTIIGAAGTSSMSNAVAIALQGNMTTAKATIAPTLPNGVIIYGREQTVTSPSNTALWKGPGTHKFYKDESVIGASAMIYDIEGTGDNFWDTGYTWN